VVVEGYACILCIDEHGNRHCKLHGSCNTLLDGGYLYTQPNGLFWLIRTFDQKSERNTCSLLLVERSGSIDGRVRAKAGQIPR
jgi:hypothetical protein